MRLGHHRHWRWVAPALLICAAAAAAGMWCWAARLPKRFAPVVDGQLYRSGAVSPAQLAHLQHEYGLRRVICLLDWHAPETQAEKATAETLGLEWENVPLRGDGSSTPQDRRRILALLSEPGAGPTLVHCAAGVNRTGLAIGLYRLHFQGWTLDQVLDEMRSFGFEDGPRHEDLRRALAAEAAAAGGP